MWPEGMLGAAALCAVSAKGAGVSSYAEHARTPLRRSRSSFTHLQLLSAPAVAGKRAGAEHVRQDPGRTAREIWICAGGIRGDAGTCPPPDRGTEDWHPIDRDAGSETACVTGAAPEKTGNFEGTAHAPFSAGREAVAPLLAEEVLRFQCVELGKTEGKAGVHASEPSHAQADDPSEAVALEQLDVL